MTMDYSDLLEKAVPIIKRVLDSVVPGDSGTFVTAIQVLRALVGSLEMARNGTVEPRDAEEHMQKLVNGLASNDEKADALLTARFKGKK